MLGKRRSRLVAVLAASLAAVLLVAGCSSGSDDGDNAADDSKAERTVKVVVLEAKLPYSDFVDGKWIGFEVEIAEQVAKMNNWKIEFIPVSFEAMIPGLLSGKYDIGASIGATLERQEIIDVVDVKVSVYRFMTKGKELGDDMMDLCGLRVATVKGARVVPSLEAASDDCVAGGKGKIDISTFADQPAATLALLSGRADATVSTPDILQAAVDAEPSLLITGPAFDTTYSGYGFSKDDDLAKTFAESVNKMIADGSYKKIMEKYELLTDMIEVSKVNPATE